MQVWVNFSVPGLGNVPRRGWITSALHDWFPSVADLSRLSPAPTFAIEGFTVTGLSFQISGPAGADYSVRYTVRGSKAKESVERADGAPVDIELAQIGQFRIYVDLR